MSVACGLECVLCVGCTQWAWRRLTYIGAYDSEKWPPAMTEDVEPIPRICRVILSVYEFDGAKIPISDAAYKLDASCFVKRVPYAETVKHSPPYVIYTDHEHKEIILAIRGLNLDRRDNYQALVNNYLGQEMFAGGYVHHGLLKSAKWVLERETETLKGLIRELGTDYTIIFTGHSLGSGIAALMTVLAANDLKAFGNISRSNLRCYSVAPARCMSLNLAVKYADVINSVILQDDFLPRTATPLQHIFGSIFCLPCLLFFSCMKDTVKHDRRKMKDPRRLYTPGRIYHIVERKFCSCGKFPPEVRSAIPVEGRFEHIVLSCNATADHDIVNIEEETRKALGLLQELETTTKPTTPPVQNKMERLQTLKIEHKHALERAVTMDVPNAIIPTEEESLESDEMPTSDRPEEPNPDSSTKTSGKTNWDIVMDKLLNKDSAGNLVLNKDSAVH